MTTRAKVLTYAEAAAEGVEGADEMEQLPVSDTETENVYNCTKLGGAWVGEEAASARGDVCEVFEAGKKGGLDARIQELLARRGLD